MSRPPFSDYVRAVKNGVLSKTQPEKVGVDRNVIQRMEHGVATLEAQLQAGLNAKPGIVARETGMAALEKLLNEQYELGAQSHPELETLIGRYHTLLGEWVDSVAMGLHGSADHKARAEAIYDRELPDLGQQMVAYLKEHRVEQGKHADPKSLFWNFPDRDAFALDKTAIAGSIVAELNRTGAPLPEQMSAVERYASLEGRTGMARGLGEDNPAVRVRTDAAE